MSVLLLTAMNSEFEPLRKRLKLIQAQAGLPYTYSGEYGNVKIIGGVTHMGMAAAERYCQSIIEHSKPDCVIFSGVAGAYSNKLQIGDLVHINTVIDHRDEKLYSVENKTRAGILLSTDKITYEPEYIDYLNQNAITAIDMETGAIAAVCDKYNIPLYVCKAISDRVEVDKASYDAFDLANSDGSPQLKAVARYLIKKPWRIFYLIKLGTGVNKAIRTSVNAVISILESDKGIVSP